MTVIHQITHLRHQDPAGLTERVPGPLNRLHLRPAGQPVVVGGLGELLDDCRSTSCELIPRCSWVRCDGEHVLPQDRRPRPRSRPTIPDAQVGDLIGVDVERVVQGATVVRVCGEVSILTAPMLRAEITVQLGQRPTVLVVDRDAIETELIRRLRVEKIHPGDEVIQSRCHN